MSAAAPLPGAGAGAVLRVTRGAAGRRAVRVGLLVGVLFALGVLCGARASAADEGASAVSSLPAAATAATDRVVRPAAESTAPRVHERIAPVTVRTGLLTARTGLPAVRTGLPAVRAGLATVRTGLATVRAPRPVARTARAVRSIVEDVPRRVTGPVLRPVTERAVPPVVPPVLRPVTASVPVPVGDLVEAVTEGPAGVSSQLPPVGGMPSLPEVPGFPEPSGRTTTPGEAPPVAVTPREPDRAVAGSRGPAVGDDGGSGGERASVPLSVVSGPRGVAGGGAVVSAPRRGAGAGDASVVRVSTQRSPGGLVARVVGGRSAVDSGGPRHMEASTLASLDRAPLSIVPGAPVTDVPDGVRDRHRDVPEFPG
ncbi:hypothetical protein [Streptomyces scabiei]|uniref:hypothetical protein n=1 Tax=Streptomyces scabiei TaxID=1930 RepID=UPI0029AE13B7|nr:hypothetical protein [Streptomyces scabiei]MDX3516483.1 hypothetical protein [Streptomyces scabiei]